MRFLAFLTYLALFLALLAGAAAAGWYFALSTSAPKETKVYTCSMHKQIRNPGPGRCPICQMDLQPLDSLPADKDGVLTIDPVVVQNTGIRVHEVHRGTLVRTLDAFGTLVIAQPALREVSLKTKGFVEELFADTEGMPIAIGDPLFAIYSPELVLAQEELIAAKKGADATLLAAAREKLALLDVDASQIEEIEALPRARRTLRFASRYSGTLIARSVTLGAAVEAGAPLLRIADLATLWLDAQVYEHQLALATKGLEVTAHLEAFPGETFGGRIVFVAPTVDPETRTSTMRVALDNAKGLLKPGMYARVRGAARVAEQALLVPREAILDSGRRQVAFVALGKGRFSSRALKLGPAGDAGMVVVTDGLAEGELVVTSGHFLLDSESRLREGVEKLSPTGLLATRPTTHASGPQLVLDAAERASVDGLVTAYLALCDRLVADVWDDALATRLASAADALVEPKLRVHREALRKALAAIPAGDLAARRKAFEAVSDAAITLVSVAAPSAALGTELFVVHCPMVPASWLQVREKIGNPFEGSQMPECGEIERRIPTHREDHK